MLHTISALKNEQSSKDGRDITPSFDVVSVREKANRVKKAEKVEDEGSGNDDNFEDVDTIEEL